jgi:hypothetical protein
MNALSAWNQRNDEPLPERELRRCRSSAERCRTRSEQRWAEMQAAAWHGLRSLLNLPQMTGWYTRDGRWRPITPAKDWASRKYGGGREHYEEVAERVLRLVAGEGGRLEMTQVEIANTIDTNRSTLRAVLGLLETSGRLMVTSRKGRGGKTILETPVSAQAPSSVESTENGHSGNSSVAVEYGAWVGPAVPAAGAVPMVSSADPQQVVSEVLQEFWGLSLHAHQEVRLLASFGSRGAVRLVGLGRPSRGGCAQDGKACTGRPCG